MGLGAYPAADPNWLGMLGMHGTFEANMAMHDCDVMICVGARFDDRVTGRLTRSRRDRRRSTSISIRPRSTRTFASMCRSSATAAMCSRI
jgi:acetolactate synthase I/II/III large subunit